MDILRFDEQQLTDRLTRMPSRQRSVFAAACAERLMFPYVASTIRSGRGTATELRRVLTRLWEDFGGHRMHRTDIDGKLEQCMELISREPPAQTTLEQICAEYAGVAVAHALRCRQNGEVHEAVSAARCAYEELVHYVCYRQNIDVDAPDADHRAAPNPIVQAELQRQQRDVLEIGEFTAIDLYEIGERVRGRAQGESRTIFDTPNAATSNGGAIASSAPRVAPPAAVTPYIGAPPPTMPTGVSPVRPLAPQPTKVPSVAVAAALIAPNVSVAPAPATVPPIAVSAAPVSSKRHSTVSTELHAPILVEPVVASAEDDRSAKRPLKTKGASAKKAAQAAPVAAVKKKAVVSSKPEAGPKSAVRGKATGHAPLKTLFSETTEVVVLPKTVRGLEQLLRALAGEVGVTRAIKLLKAEKAATKGVR